MLRSLLPLLFIVPLAFAAEKPAVDKGPETEWIKNVDYVGDGNPKHQLDLLLPKDHAGKKLPLVVFVHGGSWLGGARQDGALLLPGLVKAGFASATISYRFSSEAQWPAQMFDCKAAIRFLRAKAADYGCDPNHIAVMGMSAGGHLVSMLGTAGDVKELEGTLGEHLDVSSKVQCVVNFFGPEDFITIMDQAKDHALIAAMSVKSVTKLLGGTIEAVPEKAKQASPVTWVSKDDPPFLNAHGSADPIVPIGQAREIQDALKKAGVETHLFTMEGQGHGFWNDKLNVQIILFLNKHLRGQAAEIPEEATIPAK